MKLTHLAPQQQDSEIEEVVAAFNGTDQIRLRFLEQRRYDDTTLLTLTMTTTDWQTIIQTVENSQNGKTP